MVPLVIPEIPISNTKKREECAPNIIPVNENEKLKIFKEKCLSVYGRTSMEENTSVK